MSISNCDRILELGNWEELAKTMMAARPVFYWAMVLIHLMAFMPFGTQGQQVEDAPLVVGDQDHTLSLLIAVPLTKK